MAALATSCSEDLGGESTQNVRLDASVSVENTRAAFLKSGDFYWQTGDKIGVITGTQDGDNTKFTALTLTAGAGTGSATFEGTIAGKLGSYAIYPYSDSQTLSNGTLSYTFPSSYTYSKVDQTFFPTAKDGNSYNPAMLASISNNNVAFKHLGGVFCIQVESMPCESGTLTLTTDQSLCGTYSTSVSAETPELKTESTTSTTNNTVTINFSGATTGQTGVFYIPVPTCTYTNATVTFTKDEKEALKVVAGTYKVERSYLKALILKKVTINAELATEVESASAAETALETKNNVAITGEITGTENTITIPEVSTTSSATETKAKTLTLEKVADNAAITVADKNTSTESETETSKSVKELTVSIPNTADATKAPTVTVAMPNSTVTLAGNAGTATFKKVTASTAENTLVVSDGVTITELEVAKGNVRINKGAKVDKITLATNNTSAIIYYEDGATLPATLPEGVSKVQIIETEAQFAAALTNGGDAKLFKDLKLSNQYMDVATKVSIDLNNKTLTAKEIYSIGGDLTLKNGNIKQEGGNAMIAAGSGGKLTIDDVVYNGTGWNCIFIIQCSQKASITVKNSTINGGIYGVTTNASTKPEIAKECTIDLENSTFAADESGALLNIPATVTIKKCKFSGNHQGAFFRGGTYTIDNCEFTLNSMDPNSKVAVNENNWMKKWGSGNTGAFAALTLGNYLNPAYAYETKATFTGKNTVTVSGTYASSYPAIHVCSNAGYKVTITGFTTSGDNTMTTTGGKTPAIEYGTTGITVDGETATVNVTTTSSTE